MKMKNRLFALLLALAMIVTYMPALAFAEGEEGMGDDPVAESVQDENAGASEASGVSEPEANGPAGERAVTDVDADKDSLVPVSQGKMSKGSLSVKNTGADLDDADDLLMQYLQNEVVDKKAKRKSLNAKSQRTGNLDNKEAAVFSELIDEISNIADGESESAVIDVPISTITGQDLTITAEDLGLETLTDAQGKLTEEADEAFDAFITVDLDALVSAMLADYPYEFYWYDKTKGCTLSYNHGKNYGYSYSPSGITLSDDIDLTFGFYVSPYYSASGEERTFDVDTQKTGSAKTAADNAKEIIKNHKEKGDFEKLTAYKDDICTLTSYNEDAIAPDYSSGYGDPWQMIWVFDGVPETKVVCEGYSKAFQFLCDNSTFSGDDVESHMVTGTMYSGNKTIEDGEPHMWNILHMNDGKNYIADITNCDEGSIGAADDDGGPYLFLTGCSEGGSVKDGYSYECNGAVNHYSYYTYDEKKGKWISDTRAAYTDEELTMSDTDYSNEGEDDGSIEIEKLIMNGEEIGDGDDAKWAQFYSVDGKSGTKSLDELKIEVRDENDKTVYPDNYDILVERTWWDEKQEKDITEVIEGTSYGIAETDQNDDAGFTEYRLIVTPKKDSGYKGELSGSFYIMDKYSLNYVCSTVDFENCLWKGGWRMHDYFKLASEDLKDPIVTANDNTVLKKDTHYNIEYFRRGEFNDDWSITFRTDDPVVDDEGKNCLPTEDGEYFAHISGRGSINTPGTYYGGADVLFDIGDLLISGDDSPLWAGSNNSTKEFSINTTLEGNIQFKAGTGEWEKISDDDYEFNWDKELSDECYTYTYDPDNKRGTAVLNADKIHQELGKDSDIVLYAWIEDGNGDVTASNYAYTSVFRAVCDYDYRTETDMLPGWEGSIDGSVRAWIRDEWHQDGGDEYCRVTDVELEEGEGSDTYLLDEFYREDDENDPENHWWSYRIIDREKLPDDFAGGELVFHVTFEIPEGYRTQEKTTETYDFTVNVRNDVYDVSVDLEGNKDDALPGQTLKMKAKARHEYYKKNENGDWRYCKDDDGLSFHWFYAFGSDNNHELDMEAYERSDHNTQDSLWTSVPENGLTDDERATFTTTADGSAQMTAGEAVKEEEFYCRVVLFDGTEEIPLHEDRLLQIHEDYTTLYPLEMDDLDVGETTEQKFEVRRYKKGATSEQGFTNDDGSMTLENVKFVFVDLDSNAFKVTERYREGDEIHDSEVKPGDPTHGDTFTIKRTGDWDTSIRVEGIWNEEGKECRTDEEYFFERKDYNVYPEDFDGQIYTDGGNDIRLNTESLGDNWENKYEIKAELGKGEWNKETEEYDWEETVSGAYSFNYETSVLTIDGTKFEEYADTGERLLMVISVVKKKNLLLDLLSLGEDVVFYEDDWGFSVSDPWEEDDFPGHYDEHDKKFREDVLRGWDLFIDEHVYYEGGKAAEHYYDGDFTVSKVELVSGESVEVKEESVGEGKDKHKQWIIKPFRNGTSTVKVTFSDPKGKSTKTSPYVFDVNVVSDIYEASIDSVDGKFRVGPGETVNLKVTAVHKYTEDDGDGWQEFSTYEGMDFDWSWDNDKIATLTMNEEDHSKAVLQFKSVGDLGNLRDGTRVTVKVKDEDDNEVAETFDYYAVMDNYEWLDPRTIDPDADRLDEQYIDLSTWIHDENGSREVPGEVRYTWSFDEGEGPDNDGGVLIEEVVTDDEDDAGGNAEVSYKKIYNNQTTTATGYRITRMTDQYTRIVIRAEWGMDQQVWHAYYFDPKGYSISLDGYDDKNVVIRTGDDAELSYTVSGFNHTDEEHPYSYDAEIVTWDEEAEDGEGGFVPVAGLPEGALSLAATETGLCATISKAALDTLCDNEVRNFHIFITVNKNGKTIWAEEGRPIILKKKKTEGWTPEFFAVASDGEDYDADRTLYIEPNKPVFVSFVTDEGDNFDNDLAPIVGWYEPCDEDGKPIPGKDGYGDLTKEGFKIRTGLAKDLGYSDSSEMIKDDTYGIEIDPSELQLGKTANLRYFLYHYDGDDFWSWFNSGSFTWDALEVAYTKVLTVNVAEKIDFNNHDENNDPPLIYKKNKTYNMTVPQAAAALGDVEFHAGALTDEGFDDFVVFKNNAYSSKYGSYDPETKKLTYLGESIYTDKKYTTLADPPEIDGRNMHIRSWIKNDKGETVAFGFCNCLVVGPCNAYDKEHVAGDAVRENVNASSCTAEGSYDEVVYCTVCGEELSRETKPIAKASHTLNKTDAVQATCTEAGNDAYWTCSVCGKYFSDADGNNEIRENSWNTDAQGHKWGSVTYTWNDTNTAVTASRTCSNACHTGDNPETETVTATGKVIKAASVLEEGRMEYTSGAFTTEGFEVQTKTAAIPKKSIEDALTEANTAAVNAESEAGSADAASQTSTDEKVLGQAENTAQNAANLAAMAEQAAQQAKDAAQAAYDRIKDDDSVPAEQKETAKNNLNVATQNLAAAKQIKAAANSSLATAKKAAAKIASNKAAAAAAAAQNAGSSSAAEAYRKQAADAAQTAEQKSGEAADASNAAGQAAADLNELAAGADASIKADIENAYAAASGSATEASSAAEAAGKSSEEADSSKGSAESAVNNRKQNEHEKELDAQFHGTVDGKIPKAKSVKAKAAKKSIKVTWTKAKGKNLKKFAKVEVQWSTSKLFPRKDSKYKILGKNKKSYKITGLKKGTYYVRVANIKYVNGVKKTGKWTVKKVKVKK